MLNTLVQIVPVDKGLQSALFVATLNFAYGHNGSPCVWFRRN